MRICSIFEENSNNFQVAVATGVVKRCVVFFLRLDVCFCAAFTEESDDWYEAFETGFMQGCPTCVALDVDRGSSFNEVSYLFFFASSSSPM